MLKDQRTFLEIVHSAVFDIPPDIDADDEDLPTDKFGCVVTLQFLELHLWYAYNGTTDTLRNINRSLGHIREDIANNKPYSDYIKPAYDLFMQVLEANRNKAALPGHIDDGNYAARSADVMAAAKNLKTMLRHYR
jgi:hypothetical protein